MIAFTEEYPGDVNKTFFVQNDLPLADHFEQRKFHFHLMLTWNILDYFELLNFGLVYYSPYLLSDSYTAASVGSQFFNTSSTIWTINNSPIILTNNVTVIVGATLTITNGTVVQLGCGVSMLIFGSLNATGATFMPSSGCCWGTIFLSATSSNTQQLTNCVLWGGGNVGTGGMVTVMDSTGNNGPVGILSSSFNSSCSNALYVSGGSVSLSSSSFTYSQNAGLYGVSQPGSSVTGTSSNFVNNAYGVWINGGTGASFTLQNSVIAYNTLGGLNYSVVGVCVQKMIRSGCSEAKEIENSEGIFNFFCFTKTTSDVPFLTCTCARCIRHTIGATCTMSTRRIPQIRRARVIVTIAIFRNITDGRCSSTHGRVGRVHRTSTCSILQTVQRGFTHCGGLVTYSSSRLIQARCTATISRFPIACSMITLFFLCKNTITTHSNTEIIHTCALQESSGSVLARRGRSAVIVIITRSSKSANNRRTILRHAIASGVEVTWSSGQGAQCSSRSHCRRNSTYH